MLSAELLCLACIVDILLFNAIVQYACKNEYSFVFAGFVILVKDNASLFLIPEDASFFKKSDYIFAGFVFSSSEVSAIEQLHNGPCSVIAPVQAHLIRTILPHYDADQISQVGLI